MAWLTLEQVRKRIALEQESPAPHYQTIFRWCKTGCNGVVLDSSRRAGRRMVEEKALAAFFAATDESAPHKTKKQQAPRRIADRDRRAREALRRLREEHGVKVGV